MRVIYPEYFDKRLSWSMGRRVPLDLAYEDPELQRVALAAKKLGMEVYLDSKKHYSKTWYDAILKGQDNHPKPDEFIKWTGDNWKQLYSLRVRT